VTACPFFFSRTTGRSAPSISDQPFGHHDSSGGFIAREAACHSKVSPPWRLDPVALKGFARAVTVFVVNP
jgi:hypothetical protein